MRRDVSALVVAVEGEVQTEEVHKASIVRLAEQGGVVVGPILVEVNLAWERSTAVVGVLVDLCGDGGQLGQKLDAVVERRLPVLGLAERTLFIQLGKLGVVVEGRDGNGDCVACQISIGRRASRSERSHTLCHGVKGDRKVVHQLLHKLGQLSVLGQSPAQYTDLLSGRDLAGQQQPEHPLWQHLLSRSSLGQDFLALPDGLSMEPDTLVGVENGALPEHALESTIITESQELHLRGGGGGG